MRLHRAKFKDLKTIGDLWDRVTTVKKLYGATGFIFDSKTGWAIFTYEPLPW